MEILKAEIRYQKLVEDRKMKIETLSDMIVPLKEVSASARDEPACKKQKV